METPYLSLTIWHGVFGALLMLSVSKFNAVLQKAIALVYSMLGLVMACFLCFLYVPKAGFQFVEYASWIPSMGASYHLGFVVWKVVLFFRFLH